jgi:hypothetical protein
VSSRLAACAGLCAQVQSTYAGVLTFC